MNDMNISPDLAGLVDPVGAVLHGLGGEAAGLGVDGGCVIEHGALVIRAGVRVLSPPAA